MFFNLNIIKNRVRQSIYFFYNFFLNNFIAVIEKTNYSYQEGKKKEGYLLASIREFSNLEVDSVATQGKKVNGTN